MSCSKAAADIAIRIRRNTTMQNNSDGVEGRQPPTLYSILSDRTIRTQVHNTQRKLRLCGLRFVVDK